MNDDSEKLGNVPDVDAARAAKLSALNKLFADEDAGADFADAAAERPGDRIGHYNLIALVCEGVFGPVWRAGAPGGVTDRVPCTRSGPGKSA